MVTQREFAVFANKINFYRAKSATGFFCENFQQQSCREIIRLSIGAELLVGNLNLQRKIAPYSKWRCAERVL